METGAATAYRALSLNTVTTSTTATAWSTVHEPITRTCFLPGGICRRGICSPLGREERV